MTMTQLFFSPRGRIGRAQWWLAMIAVGIVSALGLIVGAFATRSHGFGAGRIVMALWGVLVVYLGYCVMAKRLQDRDERPAWAMVAAAVGGLQIALDIAEASYPMDIRFVDTLTFALLAARALLGSLFIVVLGCQRGTVGDNRYGPDPLSAALIAAPPTLARR